LLAALAAAAATADEEARAARGSYAESLSPPLLPPASLASLPLLLLFPADANARTPIVRLSLNVPAGAHGNGVASAAVAGMRRRATTNGARRRRGGRRGACCCICIGAGVDAVAVADDSTSRGLLNACIAGYLSYDDKWHSYSTLI
jgi:hypothetical protein